MLRAVLAFALVCVTTSVAAAKSVCIVIDDGSLLDSQFVLQKAKLGRGNVGPVQGYFALFSSASATFSQFYPISGGSVVTSTGNAALGIVVHNVDVAANGSGQGSSNFLVNITCQAGSDGKIGPVDSCFGFLPGNGSQAHFIDCGTLTAIP